MPPDSMASTDAGRRHAAAADDRFGADLFRLLGAAGRNTVFSPASVAAALQMALCGAREQETIKGRWTDVDFNNRLLTIGADGDTKNREARRVDFNPELEAHLKAMKARRAPDSQWLFPSPQRGEQDDRAGAGAAPLLRLAHPVTHVGAWLASVV